MKSFKRRLFIKKSMVMSAGVAIGAPVIASGVSLKAPVKSNELMQNKPVNENLKISLNAYSFNTPLTSGSLAVINNTSADLLDQCAKIGFAGVDLTGYYFPGYPVVPPDDYIYAVKRKAFKLGLGISGTGQRNNFALTDPAARDVEKQRVKDWIEVAEKLGAPVLRIFTGTVPAEDKITWEERAKWIAEDITECGEYGKNHGVMIGIQNHNDFLKNVSQIETLMGLIKSDWVGLLLDIGSIRSDNPYDDIARVSKFAISWQLKEGVYFNDKQEQTDYTKIIKIVRDSGYRGYVPIEVLGGGEDPFLMVQAVFNKIAAILNA